MKRKRQAYQVLPPLRDQGLLDANALVAKSAAVLPVLGLMSVHEDCYVRVMLRSMYPDLDDFVVAFGACYLQRVADVCEMTRTKLDAHLVRHDEDGELYVCARPPQSAPENDLLIMYVCCISLAHKALGSRGVQFPTRSVLLSVLGLQLPSGATVELERFLLKHLDWRLGLAC